MSIVCTRIACLPQALHIASCIFPEGVVNSLEQLADPMHSATAGGGNNMITIIGTAGLYFSKGGGGGCSLEQLTPCTRLQQVEVTT